MDAFDDTVKVESAEAGAEKVEEDGDAARDEHEVQHAEPRRHVTCPLLAISCIGCPKKKFLCPMKMFHSLKKRFSYLNTVQQDKQLSRTLLWDKDTYL